MNRVGVTSAIAIACVFAGLVAGCSDSAPGPGVTTAAPVTTVPARTTASARATASTQTTAAAPTNVTVRYGDAPSQFVNVGLPRDVEGSIPVVVLIHGGFWRAEYDLGLMEPLAADLNQRGFATWNLEYRRVGDEGGGYPGTLDDVAAGVDAMFDRAAEFRLDLSKVTVVGHSSGGHLALWLATRDAASAGPGLRPRVAPALAIGLGPVFNLVSAAEEGLGGGAVSQFFGGSIDDASALDIATPALASTTPLVVVRGADDDIVPARFTEPAVAGSADRVRYVDVPGDHFALIDPSSAAWAAVVDLLG